MTELFYAVPEINMRFGGGDVEYFLAWSWRESLHRKSTKVRPEVKIRWTTGFWPKASMGLYQTLLINAEKYIENLRLPCGHYDENILAKYDWDELWQTQVAGQYAMTCPRCVSSMEFLRWWNTHSIGDSDAGRAYLDAIQKIKEDRPWLG